MNVYTVAKASQGLADYVIKNFAPEKRKIAVSFDSRIKSDVFAKVASGVFAANGIKVEIYSELMPTPCLSFAVRYLGCAAGVMVTASHNPAKYNGYKVYGADGCQITTEAAAEILAEIEKLDIFDDVKRISFEEGFEAGKISYISEEVYTAFVEAVKKESVLGDTQVNKDVAIVYSPLNIIMFIPFGLLAPMVFERMRKVRFCVFIGFLCSCGIELSQLITQRGYCQLDDVVTNTVGMLVGWGIWKMLSSVGIAENPLF